MAITNAQQYQQLVNKPANGKRPGYRGDDAARSSEGTSAGRADPGGSGRGDTRGDIGNDRSSGADDRSSALQTFNTQKATGQIDNDAVSTGSLNDREKALLAFKNKRPEVKIPNFGLSGVLLNLLNKGVNSPIQKFADFTTAKNRNFFEDVIRGGKIPGLSFDMTEDELEEAYSDYMSNRMSGATDAYGNPAAPMGGGGGEENFKIATPIIPGDDVEEEVVPVRLGARFMGSEFDFADGGRAGMMDGGMMEDTPEGGIMDLESGRQMYFLGKLVKKATRAVKKVAKSPLGKAALMYGLGAMGGSYGAGKGFFSKGMFNPGNMMKGLIGTAGTAGTPGIGGMEGLFGKFGLTKGYGGMMPTLKGGITLGLGVPALMDLFGKKEEEDNGLDDYYKSQGIDIADIRSNPFKFMAPRFSGSQYQMAADGGRMGYAEGSKEPVAKETMPLLDMDNQEMDLREDGGFVPIGRMERADDVPARLSKNEFVFTADAVRNAGEGDIDKGAEVMYNMMKNLESGGEVSEESQGLDGAREMFQTSQRLEEVL